MEIRLYKLCLCILVYFCGVKSRINLFRPVNWDPIKIVNAEITMEIQTNNNIYNIIYYTICMYVTVVNSSGILNIYLFRINNKYGLKRIKYSIKIK